LLFPRGCGGVVSVVLTAEVQLGFLGAGFGFVGGLWWGFRFGGKLFVLEWRICEVKKRYVLFSVYFGQERATWDYMDSCTFGEEAAQESGGWYWHWCIRRCVCLVPLFLI